MPQPTLKEHMDRPMPTPKPSMNDNEQNIYFASITGQLVTSRGYIEDDGRTATIYDDNNKKIRLTECWATTPSAALDARVEQLIQDCGKWAGAIGRAEVVMKRIQRTEAMLDIEREKGFSDT